MMPPPPPVTLSAYQTDRLLPGPALSSHPPNQSSAPCSALQSHADVSRSAASELPWQQARVFPFVCFSLSFLSVSPSVWSPASLRISYNPPSKAAAAVARGARFCGNSSCGCRGDGRQGSFHRKAVIGRKKRRAKGVSQDGYIKIKLILNTVDIKKLHIAV